MRDRALRAALPTSCLGAFLLPGFPLSVFGGTPLYGWANLAGLVLLAPLVFSSTLRRAVSTAPKRARIAALTVALLVIGLKLALLASGAHEGFVGCYRSLVPPGDSQGCQRSFDDPLGRLNATKLDRTISFAGKAWDMEFFNAIDYNIEPMPGGWDQADFPFEVTWQGWIDNPTATSIPVTYTGQVTLDAGGTSHALPASYGAPATARVSLPAGLTQITVVYRFDDGHRVGGLPASIPELKVPVTAAKPWPWSQVSILSDIGMLLLLAGLGVVYLGLAGRAEMYAMSAVAVLAPLALGFAVLASRRGHIPLDLLGLLSLPMAIVLIALLWLRVRPLFMWLAAAYCGAGVAFSIFRMTAGYQLRSWHSDPLLYETFAHSMLVTGSLQAGESVFYYQPFFRYILFTEHIVFGDGDVLVVAVAVALLWFAGLWLAANLRDRVGPIAFIGLSGLLMVILTAPAVRDSVRAGLSEYPAWIALLIATALLLKRGRPSSFAPGAGLLAVAVIIRPEMLPGALALLALGLWQTGARGRQLTTGLVVFAGVSALPLAHNLYFAHSFAPFTSSTNLHDSFTFTPAEAIAAPGATIGRHLIALLDLNTTGNRVLDVAIHAGQLLWLCAAIAAISRLRRDGRWNWQPLAVLSLPLAFALPFVFVQVEVYYPRHIIATYLMVWPALMLAAGMMLGSPDPNARPVRSVGSERRPNTTVSTG